MHGVMVVNGFLTGGKFDEPYAIMSAAAGRMGITLELMRNSDLCFPVGEAPAFSEEPDFILFWDKDAVCARNLEVSGYRVFNSSGCISVCDDKALTHLRLSEAGIPSIRTIPCPMTFEGVGYGDAGFLDRVSAILGFPMVVKDCNGSFGQQVRMVHDEGSLRRELVDHRAKVFQEYVECGGEDIRIEVVGGEAVAAVRRKAKAGDFRSNATLGGSMSRYAPTEGEMELAVRASESVGADFAGVDVMRGPDGPLVCEVNSNAHLKNIEACTGIDIASLILEHISEQVGD